MNIYFREMRANAKALLLWCGGMLLMVAGGMGKYAGYKGDGQSINDLVKSMPKAVQALFGGVDLASALGFYTILFLYLLLIGALHAAMLGASIVGKEERDRTTEFLFAKPVTRVGAVTAKLSAAVTCVVLLNLFTLVISVLMTKAVGGNITGEVCRLMPGLFLLQLIFLSVGAALAAVLHRPKLAPSLASAVLLITFFLSMGIDMNEDLAVLKYVTPFQYFSAKKLLESGYDTWTVLLSVVIILLLTAFTYLIFRKKDLSV